MGRNVVVIGTQWGDEGKGAVVDVLADRASAVVRFQRRAQRRPYARHRRPEDRAALDSVGHSARRRRVPHRQRRRRVARRAVQGDRPAEETRRARRATAAFVAGVPHHLELASRCSIARASRRAARRRSARRGAASARRTRTRSRGARIRIADLFAPSALEAEARAAARPAQLPARQVLPRRARRAAAASSTTCCASASA